MSKTDDQKPPATKDADAAEAEAKAKAAAEAAPVALVALVNVPCSMTREVPVTGAPDAAYIEQGGRFETDAARAEALIAIGYAEPAGD